MLQASTTATSRGTHDIYIAYAIRHPRGRRRWRPDHRGASMTHDDLRAWQVRMGVSEREAARLLGVAPATYRDWITGKSRTSGKPVAPSRAVALACAALAAGLAPWGVDSIANKGRC